MTFARPKYTHTEIAGRKVVQRRLDLLAAIAHDAAEYGVTVESVVSDLFSDGEEHAGYPRTRIGLKKLSADVRLYAAAKGHRTVSE